MSRGVVARSTDLPPTWKSVLSVVAHPDDQYAGLGAVLDAFIYAGATVRVLCLTHGQTWTLDEAPGDLAALRGVEMASAADVLGATRAQLPVSLDGALNQVSLTRLAALVVAEAEAGHADGLLAFDTAGLTGHLDQVAATSAALVAAELVKLPVLGWTFPETVAAQLNREFEAGITKDRDKDIDLRVSFERARQRLASHALLSQTLPGSAPWRRLQLLADSGCLRWLL